MMVLIGEQYYPKKKFNMKDIFKQYGEELYKLFLELEKAKNKAKLNIK